MSDPDDDDLKGPKKYDHRVGGMVATIALVAMLGFMGFFIWLAG